MFFQKRFIWLDGSAIVRVLLTLAICARLICVTFRSNAMHPAQVRRELQTIEASSKPAVTIGDILAGGGSA